MLYFNKSVLGGFQNFYYQVQIKGAKEFDFMKENQ